MVKLYCIRKNNGKGDDIIDDYMTASNISSSSKLRHKLPEVPTIDCFGPYSVRLRRIVQIGLTRWCLDPTQGRNNVGDGQTLSSNSYLLYLVFCSIAGNVFRLQLKTYRVNAC